MNKNWLKNLKKVWELLVKNNGIGNALYKFPTASKLDSWYDKVNTLVWWILSCEQKLLINNFLLWKIDNKIESIKVKKLIINVITFLTNTLNNDEFWNFTVDKYFRNIVSNKKWVGSEYFILDSLLRNWVKANKWSPYLDIHKIDFLTRWNKWVIFWNQLTFIDSCDCAKKKSNDMLVLTENIDYPISLEWHSIVKSVFTKFHLNTHNFKIESIPDVWVLFIINSDFSKKLGENNFLIKAYIDWKDDWYQEGWPSLYFNEELKNEIDLIWKTYEFWINKFIEFVEDKNNRLDVIKKSYINNIEWWKFVLDYSWSDKTFEVSFFKEENFIYSLKFYITNKLLEKLWRKEIIYREKVNRYSLEKKLTTWKEIKNIGNKNNSWKNKRHRKNTNSKN